MHALGRADDRVDRTCLDAERASDAVIFLDTRDDPRSLDAALGVERSCRAIVAAPPGGQRLMSVASLAIASAYGAQPA